MLEVSQENESFALVQKLEESNQELNAELAELHKNHEMLSLKLLDEREAHRNALIEAEQLNQQLTAMEAEANALRHNVHLLLNSSSWKVMRPLRELGRWVKQPRSQCLRYLFMMYGAGRKMYAKLPFSVETKNRHKKWMKRYADGIKRRLMTDTGHAQKARPAEVKKADIFENIGTVEALALAREIEFQYIADPDISIIIPVYGKVGYTLRCLRSIADLPSKSKAEIIVVDDCSPDDSAEVLGQVRGIHLLKNEKNSGFIVSCNAGASAARGQYVYFLNNDTEVTEGWLDSLAETFNDFPGTGLAGSKLVYPDGRLQEAGGIVWKDASAWNFGKFDDPDLPEYNYAREVDYCSGASIMIPTELFRRLGGFDEAYKPAYYEDVDLAFKIREAGYRVIYQSASKVIHYEGVSSGTDVGSGVKAYQVENAKKIFSRWKDFLASHALAGEMVESEKDRQSRARVLVIDHCTPTPDQDAGSLITFNMMLLLREMGYQVTFMPEDNFSYVPGYTNLLQSVGVEVYYAPYVNSVEEHVREKGGRYGLVLLSRPEVFSRHISLIKRYCANAKIIYDTVDLHYLRMQREAALSGDEGKRQAALRMKFKEFGAIRAADATILKSKAEHELLSDILPKEKLHVFPLIMDIRGEGRGFSERRDLIFIGGFQHTPNVDAARYFVLEVFPLVKEKLPDARVYIVGSKPPEEVLALQGPDVVVTGYVENLTPLLHGCRVSIAPLRYGAGIKGKIGTAMAAGLPVVATSIAAEGMSLSNEVELLVADAPADFANAIEKLYTDSVLWKKIQENGLEFARRNWGASAAYSVFSDIVESIGAPLFPREYPLKLYSEASTQPSKSNPIEIHSVGAVRTREEYLELLADPRMAASRKTEGLDASQGEGFSVDGYCLPCARHVAFVVDDRFGGSRSAGRVFPNWRERLECPNCRMNSRQRLIAALVSQALEGYGAKRVYFMEQVTPIFNWSLKHLSKHELIGSEYLGHDYEGGTSVNGIRHEDVENLSFDDSTIDLIVSNDVLEHVPHPEEAFRECARVLRPGGTMLMTIPFYHDGDTSAARAKIEGGELVHLQEPQFHGNPVSSDGALVFSDFGWDILDLIKSTGFSDAALEVFCSEEYGHVGCSLIVFKLSR